MGGSLREPYFCASLFSPHFRVVLLRGAIFESPMPLQKEILANYSNDFAKHAGNETQRIRMVWDSIPSQLAKENKKFIYGAVKKGGRARELENAIQWLVDAGLVYKVY